MNDADASFEAHSTPAFTPHFDCFRSILSLDGIALVLYMLRAEFGCEEMACESSWVLVRRKGTDDGGIIELSLFFFLTLFFFRATSSSTSSPSSSFFLSLRPPPRPRRTTPPLPTTPPHTSPPTRSSPTPPRASKGTWQLFCTRPTLRSSRWSI